MVLVRRGRAGALRARERAVMLTAVQSLRLACSEGVGRGASTEPRVAGPGWRVRVGVLRTQREL